MAALIDQQRLEDIARPVAERHGFELVEAALVREGGCWVVRVLLERPEGVTLADCARVSRDLSPVLDVEDRGGLPPRYSLEVSSPGLNRPLRREQEFQRFSGRRARIRLRDPIDGRRNFAGTLLGAEQGRVRIAVEGGEFALPIAAIERARLEFSWPGPDSAGGKGAPASRGGKET